VNGERERKKRKKKKERKKKIFAYFILYVQFYKEGKIFSAIFFRRRMFSIHFNKSERALSGSVNILCSPRYMYFDRSSRISDRVSRIFLPNQIRRESVDTL